MQEQATLPLVAGGADFGDAPPPPPLVAGLHKVSTSALQYLPILMICGDAGGGGKDAGFSTPLLFSQRKRQGLLGSIEPTAPIEKSRIFQVE